MCDVFTFQMFGLDEAIGHLAMANCVRWCLCVLRGGVVSYNVIAVES